MSSKGILIFKECENGGRQWFAHGEKVSEIRILRPSKQIKANVIFSINVNLLKFVFMKCDGEILNLEYSEAAVCCVLGMRILLVFLFLSLKTV